MSKEYEKTVISLNEYRYLKKQLEIYKKIPQLKQEVAILERAIDRLEVWA